MEEHAETNRIVETIHQRFQHASANEMKNIVQTNKITFHGLSTVNIDNWYQEQGRFCSGCAEGKLKEHARVKSKKPLMSATPGEVTVGDIMFVELKNNVKNL